MKANRDSRPGIILIDKPKGVSSAWVVGQVKHRFNLARVGHAGTLDPMATGLLVLLTGRATKLADWAQGGHKQYSGEIKFGVVTDSDDITGQVIASSTTIPTFSKIQELSLQFVGQISQVPPNVSAIKVDGQRAYELSRRNEDFKLRAREVTVTNFDLYQTSDQSVLRFVVGCSKGTYIRSLARDLGQQLGCGGCLNALRREACFPFNVSEAVTLESLSPEHFRPWQQLFPSIPSVILGEEEARRLSAGDQRVLSQLELRLGERERIAGKVLYFTSSHQHAQGILSRVDNRWQIEASLPHFAQ